MLALSAGPHEPVVPGNARASPLNFEEEWPVGHVTLTDKLSNPEALASGDSEERSDVAVNGPDLLSRWHKRRPGRRPHVDIIRGHKLQDSTGSPVGARYIDSGWPFGYRGPLPQWIGVGVYGGRYGARGKSDRSQVHGSVETEHDPVLDVADGSGSASRRRIHLHTSRSTKSGPDAVGRTNQVALTRAGEPEDRASGARIDASGTVNLVNDISLSANGTFGGTGNLTLSGVVSNTTSRTLAKVGSGQLTLANANTYQGGTTLSGGTLVVGNSQALGSGSLTVASASTLASSQAVTLSNQVSLASNLTVAGANDLRLNGVIDSTGAFKLIKTGSGNLTLAAANTFSDGIDLNSGTLTLATNSGVLGSGTLTVTGNSRLAFDAPLNTSTPIVINSGATLDLAVNQDLLLFNGISGGGNLTKTGTAEATLFQTGTLGGQVDVQAGKLTAMASNALGSGTPVNIASGATLSLGADTALACDFVIASEWASFTWSYIHRGIVPDGGGMYFLPRRVGLSTAKQLIFTGRKVDADEALSLGIVDRKTTADRLLAWTRDKTAS